MEQAVAESGTKAVAYTDVFDQVYWTKKPAYAAPIGNRGNRLLAATYFGMSFIRLSNGAALAYSLSWHKPASPLQDENFRSCQPITEPVARLFGRIFPLRLGAPAFLRAHRRLGAFPRRPLGGTKAALSFDAALEPKHLGGSRWGRVVGCATPLPGDPAPAERSILPASLALLPASLALLPASLALLPGARSILDVGERTTTGSGDRKAHPPRATPRPPTRAK